MPRRKPKKSQVRKRAIPKIDFRRRKLTRPVWCGHVYKLGDVLRTR